MALAAVAALGLVLSACTSSDDKGSGGASDDTPGVTADAVRIGFVHATETASAGSAIGSEAEDPPLERAVKILADDVNKDGGLLDRKIEVVFAPINSQSPSWTDAFQAACSRLTQDNEVFAVGSVFAPQPIEVLAQCLSEKGSILAFDNAGSAFDQELYDRWKPYVYGPGNLYIDRIGGVIDRMGDAGAFEGGAKVGIIHSDSDSVRRALDKAVKPALGRHGASVAAQASVTPLNSQTGLGILSRETTSAVLQFQAAKVTHVLFVGSGPAGPLTFLTAAQAQKFKPRYLFTSDSAPSFLTTVAGQGQLENALGVGWNPAGDLDDKSKEAAPGRPWCLDTLTAAGYDTTVETNQLFQACNFFEFLKAITATAESFDADELRAAYPKIDSVIEPVSTFSIAPKKGRGDGVDKVAVFRYDAGCKCFRYSEDPKPLP